MNITRYLADCVNDNRPVSFSKYGDGEYACANRLDHHNCDNDIYSVDKQKSLIDSFKYMVENTDNAFIGIWNNVTNTQFWESIVSKPVKWALYHSILIDNDDMQNKGDTLKDKILLYKSIKESKLKKIIVCNPLLIKSKELLNIDYVIEIPLRNWFETDKYKETINNIKNIVGEDEQLILITCCGMSAKILIADISKLFPKGIYLDFGSGLDIICTKKDSRGWKYNYDDLKEALKDIIPDNWENDKYNIIYELASQHFGLHLRK
jgi:hypothetical protein